MLYGRQFDRPWRMPVVNTADFTMKLNPWVVDFPDDPLNPNFDRMVQYAATKNMQVSVIFLIAYHVWYFEASVADHIYIYLMVDKLFYPRC